MNSEVSSIISKIKNVNIGFFKISYDEIFLLKRRFKVEEIFAEAESGEQCLWKFNNQYYGEYCRNLQWDLGNIADIFDNTYGDARKELYEELNYEIQKIIIEDHQTQPEILSKINPRSIKDFEEKVVLPMFENRWISFREFLIKINDDYTQNPQGKEIRFARKRVEVSDTLFSSIGFCWNKSRDLTKDIVILHSFLCSHGFIDKGTSIADFKLAFNCKFINSESPLHIPWIKRVKGKESKGLLFHFVDQLEHLNLMGVTMQNLALFNKISLIFCGPKGKSFDNLAISKSQWLNQRKSEYTPQELELDGILYKLFYLN